MLESNQRIEVRKTEVMVYPVVKVMKFCLLLMVRSLDKKECITVKAGLIAECI